MTDKKLTMREVMLADCYEREMDQLRELLGEAKAVLHELAVESRSDGIEPRIKARAVIAKIETALGKGGDKEHG